MLEQYTRRWYQKIFVDPIAKCLIKYFAISANKITILAVIFGLLCALCLYFNWSILAVFFIVLSGYCDTLDGTIARITKTSTAQGSILDIVADRVVEFFIVVGLYSLEPHVRATASLWMLGAFMICTTSFLVVGIFTKADGEKSFYYSPGLIERAEAFIFFILMILLPSWFNLLAIILIILVLYTTVYRVWQFYQYHEKEKNVDTDN